MNRRLVIPDKLRRMQSRASNPGASAWVSANAGSGKTHVLTQRVLRLLLNGTLDDAVDFSCTSGAQGRPRLGP